MWTLELLVDDGAVKGTVPLVEGTYTIGRKGSNISFATDRSVSRRHAEVRVGPLDVSDPFMQPVWIKDVGSKLKTFVNGEDTTEVNKEVTLKDGDLVKVGTASSVCRLRFQELRLCGTRLSKEEKIDLKFFAKKTGAKIVPKWDQRCTHLVTPAAFNVVTEKLVLAVADAKPVVHGEWLKALVGGGTNKPLKPTPEITAFRPVVLTIEGPFFVKVDPSRSTHLEGEFFVALYKDEVFENIAMKTGAILYRAYMMSKSDFAERDWLMLAAGRRGHYLQPLPDDPVSPKIAARVVKMGSLLEKLGMEATTKRQLAEAVVYLQPLVSLREAMRANASGAVAGLDQTANQAWGLSQSLAPSQAGLSPSQAFRSRAIVAAAATAAAGSNMPPPENACSPKSIRASSAAAQATPMDVSVEPAIAGKDCVDARAKGCEDSGEGQGGAAAKKEAGVCMKERDVGEGVGKAGPAAVKPSAAEADKGGRGKGGKGDDVHGKHGVDGGGRAGEVEVGAGKAPSGNGVPKEAFKENTEGENNASGGGERLAKRQRRELRETGEKKEEHVEEGKRITVEKETEPKPKSKLQETTPSCADNQSGDPQEPWTHGKRERAASSTPPSRAAKKANRSSTSFTAAAERSPGDASSQAKESSQGGSSQQGGLSASPAGGGWLSTRRAEKRQRREAGGTRNGEIGRDGTVEDEEKGEPEEEEKEEAPLEAAVTEIRKLVSEVATSILHAYSSNRKADQGHYPLSLPNFKRFKKNTVMYGGEGLGDYVPISAMRSTLPKESERELVLAAEQQQLEEEEADAERLFTPGLRGVANRAIRGRTRRR